MIIQNTQSKLDEELTTPDTSDPKRSEPAVAKPPLPPNPPPDVPPPIVLKKEIKDDYQCRTDNSNLNRSKVTTDELEKTDNTQRSMCRDFIRGTCIKGTSCIFLHKLIISQLLGVYTFCRDFQNKKGCTMPPGKKCKFVHANVFEKENFFKTGYLPPHTMSHIKDDNVLQPAPHQLPKERATSSCSQPLPVHHPVVTPAPVISGAQTSSIGGKMDIIKDAIQASSMPVKRRWSDDDLGSSPRDPDTCEPPAKHCNNCDIVQFRLQCNKDKVKKMMRNSEETNNKIVQLTKKNYDLHLVLFSILKPKLSEGIGLNGITSSLNLTPDKEKAILNQLNLFLATNNELSLMYGDQESLVNSNISNLLAKHIRNSGDTTFSPDAM